MNTIVLATDGSPPAREATVLVVRAATREQHLDHVHADTAVV